MDAVMLHGEETRRATVAMEMIRTGDWIVPDLQGDVFFMSNRPPLQAWLIASIGTLRGSVDPVAVRLPSALAMVGTTLLIYFYSRLFMAGVGAFAAAISFASMGQILQMGSVGESDALFVMCVSASLLLWHAGFVRQWRPVLTWGLAYLFVALATLTKGPQGPVYFAASVGVYLLLTRNWRFGLSWSHVAGIGVFFLIWGAWLVPFYLRTDFDAVRFIHFGDVVRYGTDHRLTSILRHGVTYPARLFACILPWSILLLAYCARDIRQSVTRARPAMQFCATAILITIPTVWFVVDAEPRFFMSLYPCIAVLVGVLVEYSLNRDVAAPGCRRHWRTFACVWSLVVPIIGAVILFNVLTGSITENRSTTIALTVVLASMSVALGFVLWRTRNAGRRRAQIVGVSSLAVFTGLLYAGVDRSRDIADATNKVEEIAMVRTLIPRGTQLYSLDQVDHGFAYYYGDFIERTPRPETGDTLPSDVEYFVFPSMSGRSKGRLEFAWEPVAVVNAATIHNNERLRFIVVGRRCRGPVDPRPSSEVARAFYQARHGRPRSNPSAP